MKIYLASSWRNDRQPYVVKLLREQGHEVYDFKNPAPEQFGFKWRDTEPNFPNWDAEQFRRALAHPEAEGGFSFDRDALAWCDACVMLLPCGRSAALELGWCAGAGKYSVVYFVDGAEPELMYKLADAVVVDDQELLDALVQGGRVADRLVNAERLARRFHELYEKLAPSHGYETRPESAKPWHAVPAKNRNLMIDVCMHLDHEVRPLSSRLVEPADVSIEQYESLRDAVRARHAASGVPQILRAACVCGYSSGPGTPACEALRALSGG